MCSKHWQRWRRNRTTELLIEYNGPRRQFPKEYRSWDGIRQRCLYETCKGYKNYGARGIKICERWQGPHGFAHFLEDMGPKPNPKFSIDRIDVNGDYTPDNCRWASPRTQATNKRNNSKVPGVNWYKQTNKWKARYRAGGKNLGKYFDSYEDAVAQRIKWEQENPLD